MNDQTRDLILERLYKAQGPQRQRFHAEPPPLPGQPMDGGQLIDQFKALLEAQEASFKRASGNDGVLAVLEEVFNQEGISSAMASTDNVVAALDLPGWAKQKGFTIATQRDHEGRLAYKRAVFTEVEAGITGALCGFAESGTLCLTAGPDMPRLTSLAPIVHIAILPVSRLVPSYEYLADTVFGKTPPSQVILITGPSMTGDIQAIPFKGMHGPRRLIVILRDD